MILMIHAQEPSWPPTAQRPGAKRIQIGLHFVDYHGPIPSAEDVAEALNPPNVGRISLSALTNLIDTLETNGTITAQEKSDILS